MEECAVNFTKKYLSCVPVKARCCVFSLLATTVGLILMVLVPMLLYLIGLVPNGFMPNQPSVFLTMMRGVMNVVLLYILVLLLLGIGLCLRRIRERCMEIQARIEVFTTGQVSSNKTDTERYLILSLSLQPR